MDTIDGHAAFASLGVDDIEAARSFYGDTLGLDIRDSGMDGILMLDAAGAEGVMLYERPGHEPADHTVLNFRVLDIDDAVAELVDAGIELEHYDGDDGPETDAQGVFRIEGQLAQAWFRDPAGNVLSVIAEETTD